MQGGISLTGYRRRSHCSEARVSRVLLMTSKTAKECRRLCSGVVGQDVPSDRENRLLTQRHATVSI